MTMASATGTANNPWRASGRRATTPQRDATGTRRPDWRTAPTALRMFTSSHPSLPVSREEALRSDHQDRGQDRQPRQRFQVRADVAHEREHQPHQQTTHHAPPRAVQATHDGPGEPEDENLV